MADNTAIVTGYELRPGAQGPAEVVGATLRLAGSPSGDRAPAADRARGVGRFTPRLVGPAARRKSRWTKLVAEAREANLANESLRMRHETLMKELRLAEQVQRSLLPRTLPQLPRFTCGASLRPCQHLAGDFYNILRLDRDRLGVYLGDVMGHGPAAALLGVFAMQGIRTKRIDGHQYEIMEPSEVLASLNRDLIKADFPESPFVTMAYAVFDTASLELTYACGGHPPILLLRQGEAPVFLESGGALLGVFEAEFEQERRILRPGDRVAIYSDGVESIRWGGHGTGIDGLARILGARDDRSVQDLVDEAMGLAQQGDGPTDDLTLVMFQVR